MLCGAVSTLNMKVVGVGVFGVSRFRPPPPQKELGRGGVLNRWGIFTSNMESGGGGGWGGGGKSCGSSFLQSRGVSVSVCAC